MAGAPECAVAEIIRMKGCAWAGCTLLLVWASGSQASLNSARPDATLEERVAATCNARGLSTPIGATSPQSCSPLAFAGGGVTGGGGLNARRFT